MGAGSVMLQYLKNMVSSDATVSSARVINISGFVTSTGLMIADFVAKNALDTANFGLYLTYCAGGFVASKALDYFKKEPTNVSAVNS